MNQTTVEGTDQNTGGKPAWLVPTIIVVLIVAVLAGARRRGEVVDNPIVGYAVLTVGVFAFAHAFAYLAAKGGSPGLAAFFGAPYDEENC